jgi:hypothetical protein
LRKRENFHRNDVLCSFQRCPAGNWSSEETRSKRSLRMESFRSRCKTPAAPKQTRKISIKSI